ncbi:MAG: hypothetical protein HY238_25360, partial [Acidobacteria bacterium]|nr:hypothetical protein [Acidobacteriota bacterium]
YTERSNGTYNPIVDYSLLVLADALGRPELLDPARRNLDLMLYLTHPNGEVVTDYSRRQDRGTVVFNTGYYLGYRSMGVRDGNGQFASAADAIAARERDSGALGGSLAQVMLDPRLRRDTVARRPLPASYDRLVAGSGVARVRRRARSATIVSGFPSFFSLHNGDVALESVSLISAFFGKGQFVSRSLEKAAAGGYRLSQDLEAYYYDALRPEDIVTGQWSDAERETKRRRTNAQKLAVRIGIAEREAGFQMDLRADGPKGLPVLLTLGFRANADIQAEPEGLLWTAHNDLFLEKGFAIARAGSSAIRFGSGRRDHTLVDMRGAAPLAAGRKRIHLAWRAPVAETITFACL